MASRGPYISPGVHLSPGPSSRDSPSGELPHRHHVSSHVSCTTGIPFCHLRTPHTHTHTHTPQLALEGTPPVPLCSPPGCWLTLWAVSVVATPCVGIWGFKTAGLPNSPNGKYKCFHFITQRAFYESSLPKFDLRWQAFTNQPRDRKYTQKSKKNKSVKLTGDCICIYI